MQAQLDALDPADRTIVERSLPYTMTGVTRLQSLIDAVRYCERRGLPGAFAECGVWLGGSVLAMILTLQEIGTTDHELPQLVNVVRGNMSLVGPRPLPLDEDRRIEGWHRRRLDLRPGITGSWQVLGSSRIPVSEMVRLDYQYIADWSVWNDVRILLLTVPQVVRRRGL